MEPKGDFVRGAMVNRGLIVRLVTSHSLGGRLLVDQGAILVRRGGSIRGGGLHGTSLGNIGDEAGIDRRGESANPKASGTPNSEKRHCVFLDTRNGLCQ
jgi:hypothetical protein